MDQMGLHLQVETAVPQIITAAVVAAVISVAEAAQEVMLGVEPEVLPT